MKGEKILSLPCIVCGSDTFLCLDLGMQPLANALLSTPYDQYEKYPLGFAFCPSCTHGQLTHFVPPEILFNDYLYASGTGGALDEYFRWLAGLLSTALPPNARVFEIACNDGSFLESLRAVGLTPCGVDPAVKLTALARSKGLNVLTGFFPATKPEGLFDAIVAMNVLAHTPDPASLMQGIRSMLKPNGVAIIQTSQALMLINGEFDTIYHEHYSFFTPWSIEHLANAAGMHIASRHIVSVHGGSLLCVLRQNDADANFATIMQDCRFELPWPELKLRGLGMAVEANGPEKCYSAFSARATTVMLEAAEHAKRHQDAGGSLALVGVAAKALTFIAGAGIKPDYFLDEAVLKCGRFVPGAAKMIEPLSKAANLPNDTLFLLGAWNFAELLAQKVRTLRPNRTNNFLVHFPECKEFN